MPNRVIKDSIWTSPTLAGLSEKAQLHWPRWLLMADDWGCFNADPDIIKGLVYPKMKTITLKIIDALAKEYEDAGLLFIWSDERIWGFFITFHNHHFCNSTHVDVDGKQLRHKRKTPEPPKEALNEYLQAHKKVLDHVRAFKDKYRNPNPNPNPKKNKYLDFVFLTKEEHQKLLVKFKQKGLDERIENLNNYIGSKGKKYASHYHTILAWDRKNNSPQEKDAAEMKSIKEQISTHRMLLGQYDNDPNHPRVKHHKAEIASLNKELEGM
jgi:hypothetical protein